MWKHFIKPDMSRIAICRMAINIGYLILQRHIQNIQHLLLFLYNNCCKKAHNITLCLQCLHFLYIKPPLFYGCLYNIGPRFRMHLYIFIYLENWTRICESECVYYVIHRAEINSTLISLCICLRLARLPIDIFLTANEMATLKCRYIKKKNIVLLKIIADFLNWCFVYFTWP
jgi:hypothetical protein